MDKIQEMQYKNLRKRFNENLVEPILGKGYYNMAMDVYTCDEETTKDLKAEFDFRKNNIKFYRLLFIVSLIFNILLILFEIF